MWRSFTVEVIIALICPYPFFNGVLQSEVVKTFDTEIFYEWNDLMLATMFIRIYLPFRFYFYLTDFINPRTQRVCAMNGCDSDTFFALKCVLKQQPYIVIIWCLGLSIIMFGY